MTLVLGPWPKLKQNKENRLRMRLKYGNVQTHFEGERG
jgi:uncharacterized protein YegP (UPF0339 family)